VDPLVARVVRRFADESKPKLVRTNPAKVLAWLKGHGFEAALNDPKHGVFRDGVQVTKHVLRPGWVSVQWMFENTLNRKDKKTHEDWVKAAHKVFEALSQSPFLVRWAGDDPRTGVIEVVEKAKAE
jgi:hypothetical protein